MRKIPLIIYDDTYRQGKTVQSNVKRQNLLLRGMMMTGDMKAAANYAGIHAQAEVYRTLDRIGLRQDYHRALQDEGIDLRYIVRGIKDKAENAELDSVRLAALRMLLTSLGLNRYDVSEEGNKNWEDTLLEIAERKKEVEALPAPGQGYNVDVPQMPESVKAQRKQENDLGKELYES